jgi:hypothetical protein
MRLDKDTLRKLKYLRQKWGFVTIGRKVITEPIFATQICAPIGIREVAVTYFCRNFDEDENGNITRNGEPYFGEQIALEWDNPEGLVDYLYWDEKELEKEEMKG